MIRSLRPLTLLALVLLTAVSLTACSGEDDHVHTEGDGHDHR